MTVNAITDTKKGEQGLRLLIFILPKWISTNSWFFNVYYNIKKL